VLKDKIKWTTDSTRVVPIKVTLKNVIPIANKIGITRIADITEMDVLRIPNYSVVLPGTEDYIWVYSGKGVTKLHAKASALMEAVERFSALPSSGYKKFISGTYEKLSKNYDVLHPSDVVEPLAYEFSEDMYMDYINGYDIVNQKQVLVPVPLALFRYSPQPPAVNPFSLHHTNGLASGNVMEEAICHSLCELIERDAVSLAELKASAIPFHILKSLSSNFVRMGYDLDAIKSADFVDDYTIFPDVDCCGIDFPACLGLIRQFEKSKIPLFIKDITSDIGIPSFIAGSIEWITHDYGYLAEGHGTHPNARIALIRAITEVSQTRAANIQGARDDLRKIAYGQSNNDDKRMWQFMKSKDTVEFGSITTFIYDNILDDINLMKSKLIKSGLSRIIVIDLTNPNIGIPVVRTIVPGLETFKISKSVIGNRGRRYFTS
jgi:ribosomal protein S12 methylthiotransferase accessory factor